MNLKDGKIWPYAIATAIGMVFSFCVVTVYVTSKGHINESNLYMENYHKVDADANRFIEAKIAFNKKYKLTYETKQLSTSGVDVSYKVLTKDGKPVNDAKFKLVITRPDAALDIKPKNPQVKDGVYTFKNVKLPREGRWDLIVKVQVGDDYRYMSLKTDTRTTKVVEF